MASSKSLFIAFTLAALARLTISAESEVGNTTESMASQLTLAPLTANSVNASGGLMPALHWDNLTMPWPILSNLTSPLNTSLLLSNLTHQFEQFQNSSLAHSFYNTSWVTAQASQAVVTEALVRPLTFFIGQNIRLLSDGIQQLGSAINQSGYHLSSFEAAFYNTSQALSHYGMNLVNASVNFRAQ